MRLMMANGINVRIPRPGRSIPRRRGGNAPFFFGCRACILFISLPCLLAGPGISAHAADWVVSQSPDGACAPEDPRCSSIQAAVNAASPGDTLHISEGEYLENVVIDKDLSLIGMGRPVVDGNHYASVFKVSGNIVVSFQSLTLRNGNGVEGEIGGWGGGINNQGGQVTVSDVVFDHNESPEGGALYSGGGSITVDHSVFDGNFSGFGGAIENVGGAITITQSSFCSNHATLGGGIYNKSGVLIVRESTFDSNSADFGGGISNEGTLTLQNCTFASNQSPQGGALENFYGEATLQSSTLNLNSSPLGSIFNHEKTEDDGTVTSGSLTVNSSIIAGNDSGPDCSGPILSHGFNLFSDDSCGPVALTDQSGTDPRLGPLQQNGGPTLTMEPLADSPAIDKGGGADAPTSDQRGLPRNADGNNDGVVQADIGAVEYQGNPPSPPLWFGVNVILNDKVYIRWVDQSNNEEGFILERSEDGVNYTPIADIPSSEATGNKVIYFDSGLKASTVYHYRVSAFNNRGVSSVPADVSVETGPPPPADPSNLSASLIGEGTASLQWNDNSDNEEGYVIERAKRPENGFVQIAFVGPDTTSYLDPGLTAPGDYTYRVRAFNRGGGSPFSNHAYVRIVNDTIPAPSSDGALP